MNISFGPKLWLWVGIAALVASGWGYSAFKSSQLHTARIEAEALTKALDASEAENKTLRSIREADTVANETVTKSVKQLEAKEAKRHEEVTKVITANPDWANQPLPDGLADSLRS